MVEPSVTTMVITVVDLQCHKCYKKIKKLLCKFPEIRDPVYDEKKNTVTIKVVSCCPEKIKQKICCKGGESVKGIEIIVPSKPDPKPSKTDPDPKPSKTDPKPKPTPCPPVVILPSHEACCTECSKGRSDGPCYPSGVCCTECSERRSDCSCDRGCGLKHKKKQAGPCYSSGVCCTDCSERRSDCSCDRGCGLKNKKKQAPPCYSSGVCCTDCSQGRSDGPCNRGCVYPPPWIYNGYCGRPVYDSWGGGYRSGYYVREEGGYCVSEEIGSSCSIM